jgi:hypothetical protein
MIGLLAPAPLAAIAAAGQGNLTMSANPPAGLAGLRYPDVVTHGGAGPWSY